MKPKYRPLVLLLSLGIGGLCTLWAAWPSRLRRGYEPPQPIAFSHRLHAGVMQIGCRYCHSEVLPRPEPQPLGRSVPLLLPLPQGVWRKPLPPSNPQ